MTHEHTTADGGHGKLCFRLWYTVYRCQIGAIAAPARASNSDPVHVGAKYSSGVSHRNAVIFHIDKKILNVLNDFMDGARWKKLIVGREEGVTQRYNAIYLIIR